MSKSKLKSALFLKNDKWHEWQEDIRIKRTNLKKKKNDRNITKDTATAIRSL